MRGQERLPVRDLTGSFFADVLSKNGHPEKLLWYRFDSPEKVRTVIFIEGDYVLFRLQNDKSTNI